MFYSQYSEDKLINDLLQGKTEGFVVDVGAADGVRYSNSRYFIESLGWGGVLVEPHPDYFKALQQLYSPYSSSHQVRVLNCAVGPEEGTMPFYLYGRDEHAQVSTLSEEFKNRVISVHGDKYEAQPVEVEVKHLRTVLQDLPGPVDLLSIDCEGIDMSVLQSHDWKDQRPNIVCVEHSMPMFELHNFMISMRYKFIISTEGNSIFQAIN